MNDKKIKLSISRQVELSLSRSMNLRRNESKFSRPLFSIGFDFFSRRDYRIERRVNA